MLLLWPLLTALLTDAQSLQRTFYKSSGHTLTPTFIYQHPILPLFFTGNQDGKIKQWNSTTGAFIQDLTQFKEWSYPWTSINDDVLIVTGTTGHMGEKTVLRAVHIPSGELVRGDLYLPHLITDTVDISYIETYQQTLLLGLTNGEVRQLSFPELALVRTFSVLRYTQAINDILVHNVTSTMYTASVDGTIRWWSFSTGNLISTFPTAESTGQIQTLNFYGANALVSSSSTLLIAIWSLNGTLQRSFTPFRAYGLTQSIVIDETFIGIAQSGLHRIDLRQSIELLPRVLSVSTRGIGYDMHRGKMYTYAMDNKIRGYDLIITSAIANLVQFNESQAYFKWSSIVSLSDQVLFTGGDRVISRFNLASGALIGTLQGHVGTVKALLIVDTWLISADGGGIVKQWDVITGNWIRDWPHTAGEAVNGLVLRYGIVMTSSFDGYIRLWDPKTGTLVRTIRNALGGGLYEVGFTGDYIVARTETTDVIRLWQYVSGDWAYDLYAFNYLQALFASSLGDDLYISDLSGVYRYNSKSRQRERTYSLASTALATRAGGICSMYVAGNVLFGGQCYDGLMGTYQWDVSTGELIRVLQPISLLWAYGRRLFLAGRDGSVTEWNIPELPDPPLVVTTRNRTTSGTIRRSSTMRRSSPVTSAEESDDGFATADSSSPSVLLISILVPTVVLLVASGILLYVARRKQMTGSSARSRQQHAKRVNQSRQLLTAGSISAIDSNIPSLSPVTLPSVSGITSIQTASTNLSGGSVTTTISHINPEISIPVFLELRWGFDFRQGEFITKGGGGEIYYATSLKPELTRRSQNCQLAVKSIAEAIEVMSGRSQIQFFQEVALMWRFRDHANFIKLFAFSTRPVTMVMKLYYCGDLERLIMGESVAISKGVVYSKRCLVDLIKQVCIGVAHMHHCGIVHCDLKPANVLLDIDPATARLIAVLADFGISRIVDKDQLKVDAFNVSDIRGASLCYAGPETITRFRDRLGGSGPIIWKAGDVYALGLSLLHMLTRILPWSSMLTFNQID